MFQQLRTSPSRTTVLPFGGALSLHLATLLLIVLLIWFYIRQVDEARLIPARKKSFWKVFLCLSGVLVHHCLAAAARIPRVTSSPMPSASEPGPARVLASRKLAEAIRLRNTAGIKNRHRRPPPADPRELGRSERTTSDESLGLVGWLFGPNRPMYRWTARGPGEDVHLSPLPIIRSSRRPVTGTLFEGEVLLGGVPFGCRR